MRNAVLVVVFVCAYGVIPGQTHPAPPVNVSRRVAFFEVHDRNMMDALLMFGQQEHIGIGIEYIDAAAFQNRTTIQLRDRTMAEVFDAITEPLGYRWSTDGQVVTVTHDGAMVGKRNLLNTRIPKFKVDETTMREASRALHIKLFFVLNPDHGGIAGDDPGGNRNFRIEPFEMKNATVRAILNRIVSQHGNGAWVIQQPPWTMGKDLGRGIWRMVEYDRTDGDYSRGLEIWGLGLHKY